MNLSDVIEMDADALDRLFSEGATPALDALEGPYRGVLLTGQLPPSEQWFSIRFVNQPWFPWKGKLFERATGTRGRGANRFEVAGQAFTMWPFETVVQASRFGGPDVVEIDYDIPHASFWQRKTIFDEIRQIGPELYLGKGGVAVGGVKLFVFVWAITPDR